MNLQQIIKDLRTTGEAHLAAARHLEGISGNGTKNPVKRFLSAAARARIGDAPRTRWAAVRRAKNAA